jgi:hypothetical protein
VTNIYWSTCFRQSESDDRDLRLAVLFFRESQSHSDTIVIHSDTIVIHSDTIVIRR